MKASIRPRRSVLYMPASNSRALEKGKSLPADGLILDLEDAVAPDAKESARESLLAAVQGGGYGQREIILRVNGLDTPWGYDDLARLARAGADCILLPKVSSADYVRAANAVLSENGADERLSIWCMMETPRGILRAEEIADAPGVTGLVAGTSDLTKELQASHTPNRHPLQAALSMMLLAGRASGCAVIDGVHLDLSDEKGFEDACRHGAEMGFDGKTLIHPKQLAPCNTIFSPSTEEVAWSKKIIVAYEESVREQRGVVVVDGKLIENLHVDNARRIVKMADMIAESSG